jgi:hypothetical protein
MKAMICSTSFQCCVWEQRKWYDRDLRVTHYSPLNRSNFLGTKFTVYDAHPPCAGAVVSKGPSAHMIGSAQVSPMKPPPAGNYPVSHISYEVNVLGSRYGKPCDRTSILRILGSCFFPRQCSTMSRPSCESIFISVIYNFSGNTTAPSGSLFGPNDHNCIPVYTC